MAAVGVSGIEGTLLQILGEDMLDQMSLGSKKRASGPPVPNTEFIVNITDCVHMSRLYVGESQSCMVLICAGVQVQEQNRVPLFSFSKPQYFDPRSGGGPFFDIMYPAWTFWGGGMMPRPYDACG